jgi:hypothetical protein
LLMLALPISTVSMCLKLSAFNLEKLKDCICIGNFPTVFDLKLQKPVDDIK